MSQRQLIETKLEKLIDRARRDGEILSVIRASNTQPALVHRFEASSHAGFTKMQEYIDGILAEVNN